MNRNHVVIGIAGLFAAAVSVSAAPKKHAVRIMVKGEVEKTRDSSKEETEKSSTKTKSETQFYDLQITVFNTIKKDGTFDLEWYFFKRNLNSDGDKSDPVLCEKDKKSLTIGGMKRAAHAVKSQELTWSEVKSSKESSKGSSGSGKTFNGSLYDGYIVLVKHGGQIVAEYSNEKKYLTEEWLGRLEMPVQSGSAKTSSSKKNKKKNKK